MTNPFDEDETTDPMDVMVVQGQTYTIPDEWLLPEGVQKKGSVIIKLPVGTMIRLVKTFNGCKARVGSTARVTNFNYYQSEYERLLRGNLNDEEICTSYVPLEWVDERTFTQPNGIYERHCFEVIK